MFFSETRCTVSFAGGTFDGVGTSRYALHKVCKCSCDFFIGLQIELSVLPVGTGTFSSCLSQCLC